MHSGLADFIESNSDAIVDAAMVFARTVVIGKALDEEALRDHLPDIVEAIVQDLRTPQSADEALAKSEGRARAAEGAPRAAAATHALFRAHSGFNISQLVSEYRALRASVLRLWAESPGAAHASAEEVTRFNEAIDEAIAESVGHYADEVERWRNIFLGVLGHDLRSPLNAIVMTSELIGRMAVDAPIATAAQRLIRSGQRMSELLDKLLVYNRAQIGIGFEIDRQDVDLDHECRDEIDMLEATLPGTQIAFASEGDVRGKFDAPRVREALSNLVVNASKYGTRGERIQVTLRGGADGVELSVRNTGQPLSPDKFDLMFEPLRRAGIADGESERVSLGLGLFIVSQIAQAHGGDIKGESTDGMTTFKMHLPRD